MELDLLKIFQESAEHIATCLLAMFRPCISLNVANKWVYMFSTFLKGFLIHVDSL